MAANCGLPEAKIGQLNIIYEDERHVLLIYVNRIRSIVPYLSWA
jgi:hypothetical protein